MSGRRDLFPRPEFCGKSHQPAARHEPERGGDPCR